MTRRTRNLVKTLASLVVLGGIFGGLLTGTAFAQAGGPDAARRRGGLGIGVVWTNQRTAKRDVGKFVSLRVSVPAGNHAGFDFDLGVALRGDQTLPRGHALTAGTRVRWLPKARGETGVTGYLLAGVRLVRGSTTDAEGKARRYSAGVVDWPGIGVDYMNQSGHRGGFEFGQSLGFGNPRAGQDNVEPVAVFTNFFALGGR